MFRHVTSSAFHAENPALPEVERVVQAVRFLGRPYRDAKRLAELMSALWELAPSATGDAPGDWWPRELDTGPWAADNDCSKSEQRALRERVALIAGLERELLQPPDEFAARLVWRAATSEARYLRWLDALDDSADARMHAEPVGACWRARGGPST